MAFCSSGMSTSIVATTTTTPDRMKRSPGTGPPDAYAGTANPTIPNFEVEDALPAI